MLRIPTDEHAAAGPPPAKNLFCRWLEAHHSITSYWPLVVAVIILWLAIVLLAAHSLELQDVWTYARDDAYIQMSVAKNIAEHGSWGINPGEFNSTSSSPLWSILLAGTYLAFGANDYSPLVMNILFVTLVVVAVFLILKKQGLLPPYNFLVLLAVIFFAPLPALVLLGMEHGLQILLAILFVYLASLIIAQGKKGALGTNALWMLAIAPALVFCRFEGLFLVVTACLLLLLKRRWLLALCLGVLGALPVLVFGLISISAGGGFLPNPLTLKSRIPLFPFANWLKTNLSHAYVPIVKVASNPLWLILVSVSLAVIILSFTKWDLIKGDRSQIRAMNVIFLVAVYLHFQTNNSQHFRYDAYLVSLGIIVVSIPIFGYLSTFKWPESAARTALTAIALTALLMVAVLPFAKRGFIKMRQAPRETRLVFEEQYQMARFLDRYYSGKGVAVNDIGAVSYYADINTVDLWGLGSNDVAKRRMEIRKGIPSINEGEATKDLFVLSKEEIDEITRARGTHIALVYNEIFEIDGESRIPDNWIPVGRWLIYRYDLETGYYDKVSFYAVNPEEEAGLIENLRQFSGELPVSVIQDGKYTGTPDSLTPSQTP